MKILYGVVGEGMGHAIRSQVVIKKLLDNGHDIQIMD
jgi:UDP:flavonoid glycosyltransferase YjiC (YdhE family)